MSLAQRLTGPALGALGLALLLAVATLPPAPQVQGWFAIGAAVAALAATAWRRRPAARVLLLAVSGAVSCRYLFWRGVTLGDSADIGLLLLSLVLLALEGAALLRLWRGLSIGVWPLRRPPWPLPVDPGDWPDVEVWVVADRAPEPTVRASLLAALGLDWPAHRLRVCLLDERARPELQALAETVGCAYATGPEVAPGNALRLGDSPYLALIAAGDMPVRAFLQLALGWLVARPDLGFVQGQVGAPDALSRRQDGADTFVAARFTGSGAVLRRAALVAAGGWQPTARATHDRLRRAGWRGAFLALPVAGGRAAARRHPWADLAAYGVLLACPIVLLAIAPAASVLAYAAPHLAALGLALLSQWGRRRAPVGLPVQVLDVSGRLAAGQATALHRDGATLLFHRALSAGEPLRLRVALGEHHDECLARACGPNEIAWEVPTLRDEARLVRAVFGRADAWIAAASLLLLTAGPALAQAAGDFSVRPIPGAPAETLPAAEPAAGTAANRTVVFTLHQLGAAGPLALRGTQPVLTLPIGVRSDEVVTAATLSLDGAVSPALLPQLSNVTVTLNGQYLATIPADRRTPAFNADVPIAANLFRATNALEFRLAGRSQADCDDPLSPLLWATIADSSTITLTLAHLPPQRDLARLPAPFFDAGDPGALALPFVLPADADSQLLQAAGTAASWFGQLAGRSGARFPAAAGLPASGNAVLLQVAAEGGDESSPLPGAPPIDGPTLAVLPNPHDGLGSVLLIAGRTDAEAITAARALAFGIRALTGPSATVQAPDVAARVPYDAPAWVATDRPVRLGALAGPAALQGSGYAGLLTLPLRTAPDLYTWGGQSLALDLRWQAPPSPIADLAQSRLDVGLDDNYLASLPLADAAGSAASHGRVAVPADDITGEDRLQIAYDARPVRRTACAAIPADLHLAIDPDSTLDLSRAHHIARLPNLGFFATSGFPFTRLADLSQTAIVLPEQPSAAEIGAYLDVMGRFGAETGLPAASVTVVRPGEVAGVADRDMLVIGTLAGLQSPGLAGLLGRSPVGFADGKLHVRLGPTLPAWLPGGSHRATAEQARVAAVMASDFAGGLAVLVGAENALVAGRSVVALVGADAAALQAAGDVLGDPGQRRRIQGDLTLISGGQVTSYRVGPTYTVGRLPLWLWPAWYLADAPLADLVLLLAGCGLVAVSLTWWLSRRSAAQRPPRLPSRR